MQLVRRFRAVTVWLLGTAVMCSATVLLHTWFFTPLRIDWFFARTQLEEWRADPERLSQRGGFLAAWEQADTRLTDLSPEAHRAAHARRLRQRKALADYDCRSFEGERQQSCEVLRYSLDQQIEAQRWRQYDFPLNQLFGLQHTLPAMLLGQGKYESPSDAEAYLARLAKVPEKIDGLLLDLAERQRVKILPPRSMVAHVLDDLRQFVAPLPADSLLVRVLDERLRLLPPARMPDLVRAQVVRRAEVAVEMAVYPAWQKLIAHFEGLQALPLNDDGAWSRPDGTEFYASEVRRHTTTQLGPQAIHALGLREVERINTELDQRLAQMGLVDDSVVRRLHMLARRPSEQFGEGDTARLAIVTYVKQALAASAAASASAFDLTSSSEVIVEAVSGARERSAPGAYYSPAVDSEHAGIVYLNLRILTALPRYSLRALAHHEGVPGHHLQSAWLQARDELPAFRQQLTFTAYAEGWAMYAEWLAGELGLLSRPEDEVGRLQSELFRAARLVADTGLHWRRWDLETAARYLEESAGLGPVEARAEVERYLVVPGQALSFYVGLQTFRGLRSEAEADLGTGFDGRAFHAMLLDGGRLPLGLLEQRVQRWIEAQRASESIH